MKKSIKITVLFLLVGTGLFAEIPAKNVDQDAPLKEAVFFSLLPSAHGVDVKVKNTHKKAVVNIYDKLGNLLLTNVLSTDGVLEKAYLMDELDDGDYVIAVASDKQEVRKTIRVFNSYCLIEIFGKY